MANTERPTLLILGTRGIPAAHGGFETFAERLALFLTRRGWDVGVYCQDEDTVSTERIRTEQWHGIELIRVAVAAQGPRATLEFDWYCVRDAARRPGVCLVLGYNGALFLPYLRAFGRKIIVNMDGIEWRRPKWSAVVKTWFWINEWIAAWSAHRMVADHPGIADHLATRRSRDATVMIPYGGDPVERPSDAPIRALGLEPGRYLVSIARVEPDNNIALMVEAFSRERRDAKLVVLGGLDDKSAYHRAVRAAASDEVVFPGPIYDAETVSALRFHAAAYLHGHMVGGTNPSLVEALWAGNAVIAHDNLFNRWTAGAAGFYFTDAESCSRLIDQALAQDFAMRRARVAARQQAAAKFDWDDVFAAYERELWALSDVPMPSYAPAPTPLSGAAGRSRR